MEHRLTEGAIEKIMDGDDVSGPILQIIELKGNHQESNKVQQFISVSDGIHYDNLALLLPSLARELASRKILNYSIVKVTKYVTRIINYKRIMVIVSLDILQDGSEVGKKIGNPRIHDHPNLSQQNDTSSALQQQQPPQKNIPLQSEPAVIQPEPTFVIRSVNNERGCSPKIHLISDISLDLFDSTIKVRVDTKKSIYHWSNENRKGKLLNVYLVDRSGEIQATIFNDDIDLFHNILQENEVFLISQFRVKRVNKNFCYLNNDYELNFDKLTQIIPCNEDDSSIPKLKFNFSSLADIGKAEPGTILDVIGVCKVTGGVVKLSTSKKELKKRDVTLVDRSLTAVTLTLWESQAEDFVADSHQVIAVKGGKVSEFGGMKSISLVGCIKINPELPEAYELKAWFDNLPEDSEFNSVWSETEGKVYLLAEAMEAKLGCGDKTDYFWTYCKVIIINKERCLYKACPAPNCLKKVIEQNTGLYRCEKCNQEYSTFKNRLLLSVLIGDFSDELWVTIFNDVGEEFLKVKADHVSQCQEENYSGFSRIFQDVLLKPFLFRLSAKSEIFNGESRVKFTVVNYRKLDYKSRCQNLISEIKELSTSKASSTN